MYFKSDVGRRAASCWALPHISSYGWFKTRTPRRATWNEPQYSVQVCRYKSSPNLNIFSTFHSQIDTINGKTNSAFGGTLSLQLSTRAQPSTKQLTPLSTQQMSVRLHVSVNDSVIYCMWQFSPWSPARWCRTSKEGLERRCPSNTPSLESGGYRPSTNAHTYTAYLHTY